MAIVADRKDESRPGNEGLQGRYANHYRVGYNTYEFVIDFGQLYEGDNEALFHTRIVTSPRYAKELYKILSESIGGYERTFGSISDES